MDIVEYADYFVCEHCGEELDKMLVTEHTNFHAVIVKPWGIKKAVRLNFQDLRYDTKYVEFVESLPQTIYISKEENEAEKEKKE